MTPTAKSVCARLAHLAKLHLHDGVSVKVLLTSGYWICKALADDNYYVTTCQGHSVHDCNGDVVYGSLDKCIEWLTCIGCILPEKPHVVVDMEAIRCTVGKLRENPMNDEYCDIIIRALGDDN